MSGMIVYEDEAEVIYIDIDKISSIRERLVGKHPGAGDQLLIYCGEKKPIALNCSIKVFTQALKQAKTSRSFNYLELKTLKVKK